MSEIVLSDEEELAIEEAQDAQSLLDNPVFLKTIERLRQQCAEAILTSEPSKAAEREDAYNLSRGLSAITVELVTIVATGETVLENATRPSEDDAQDYDPGDDPFEP